MPTWEGQIKLLSIAGQRPPYTISCLLRQEGADDWTPPRYFTADDEIEFPVEEHELILRWVLPRLE